jgi:hypothetical protein
MTPRPTLRHLKRAVEVSIYPLGEGGWGWRVAWENGGKTFGASEDFPSAVTRVTLELREGQNHVAAR